MSLGQDGSDVSKGQTASALVNGLGATSRMVLDLAPEMGRWLFGPGSAQVVSAVEAAIGAATGTSDPRLQADALANPDVASTLRVALAQIAGERETAAIVDAQAALVAQLASVTAAPTATAQLSQIGSSIAWGAPIISVIVLFTFGGVVAIALTRAMPAGAEPVLNVLLGTLGAMATSVVGYWVGSSAGSARKDVRLANLTERG